MSFFDKVAMTAFKLAYEISPIMLVGGIAKKVPDGMLPIAVFTEGLSLAAGLLTSGLSGVGFTTHFNVMAGSTLIVQDVAEYPFYDMATAANAVVSRPNRISMQMIRPANTVNAQYPLKILTFTALKMALDYHNANGGSYTILTPAYIYTGCVMNSMIDMSGFSDSNKQVQHTWQLEFSQPLLQQNALEQIMGTMMDKFNSAMPSLPSWSGISDAATGFVDDIF